MCSSIYGFRRARLMCCFYAPLAFRGKYACEVEDPAHGVGVGGCDKVNRTHEEKEGQQEDGDPPDEISIE